MTLNRYACGAVDQPNSGAKHTKQTRRRLHGAESIEAA